MSDVFVGLGGSLTVTFDLFCLFSLISPPIETVGSTCDLRFADWNRSSCVNWPLIGANSSCASSRYDAGSSSFINSTRHLESYAAFYLTVIRDFVIPMLGTSFDPWDLEPRSIRFFGCGWARGRLADRRLDLDSPLPPSASCLTLVGTWFYTMLNLVDGLLFLRHARLLTHENHPAGCFYIRR